MSHPDPTHDSENVLPEDNEESSCSVCEGEKQVEKLEYYTDENGFTQVEGTGKFIPCPECQ